ERGLERNQCDQCCFFSMAPQKAECGTELANCSLRGQCWEFGSSECSAASSPNCAACVAGGAAQYNPSREHIENHAAHGCAGCNPNERDTEQYSKHPSSGDRDPQTSRAYSKRASGKASNNENQSATPD